MNTSERFDFIAKMFTERKGTAFFIDHNGQRTTHEDFLQKSIRLLNFLVAQGARYGDRIIIGLDNRPEYLELITAIALGGMMACPVDPELSASQMNKTKQVTKARLSITSYSQLAYSLDNSVPECAHQGVLNEPFLMVFSSGTTGQPKGIVQSVKNFFDAAISFSEAAGFAPGESTFHSWPMFYNAGLFNQFACPLVSGGSIVIGKRFSAKKLEQFWQDVEKYKPSYIYLSPTMASSLVKTFRFFTIDKCILRHSKVISTSSILYPVIKKEFYDLFGVHIIPCFGITELGGSFTIGTENSGPYSVGKAIEGVEISLDKDADGEILVSTPYMATGYLDASGDISPMDRTIPFRSGDLGWIENNELFVSGRNNDSIKKGGEMINLSEIEDMVIASGLCDECLAIGRPDLFWGETYDLVYLNKDANDPVKTRDALNRLINDALPQTQRPTKIRQVDDIPKTTSGKSVKRLIKYETDEG